MNPLTTVLPPFLLEKKLEAAISSWRERASHPIAVQLWNGKRHALGDSPKLVLHIRSPKTLARLMEPSLATLGAAYVEGELDFEGHMRDAIDTIAGFIAALAPAHRRARPRKARHTRKLDSDSIQHHYDVSNDFYRLWLDEQMVYSCAYFRSPDDGLEQAQIQKIDHILHKIRLQPGERLLDIGCGWGALALRAARDYGAHCVGVTLSRQQYEEATRRVRKAGLEGRCEIRLQDYRDVDGRFDKITSVGMFEHVGLNHLGDYFRKIRDLLAEGGIALNHGITSSDPDSGESPYGGGDFIDRYVFPNGELPLIGLVLKEMGAAGLEAADIENLRLHYARTLEHWTDRFEAHGARLRELAGDTRYRIWRAYLAGCAYGFAHGWVALHQIVACRPGGPADHPLPLTRDYMYPPHQLQAID